MPQEAITRHFDMRQGNEETPAAIVESLTKKKKIDRSAISPILQKSFHKAGDDRSWERMKEFFMAWNAGDNVEMSKHQKRFRERAIEMYNAGEIELKTLSPWNETTNSAGGYNVPPEFAADIARNLGQFSIPRLYFRHWAMKSNKTNIPGLLGKPTVATVAENAIITASKPTEDQTVLTAKKIAGIFPVTNEALEDSNIEIYPIMLEIFAEQFGLAECIGAFQNANTDWNGLLWYGAGTITSGVAANGALAISRTGSSTGGATGYPQISDAASATDAWNDLIYVLGAQKSAYYQGGIFFIDQNVLLAMMAMRDSNKRFIADIVNGLTYQMGLDGQPKLYFKGYQIVVVPSGIMLTYDAASHVSTPFTVFCNPQRSWTLMGERGGFRVDTLREGTLDNVSLAANDLQAMRMVERVAFATARPDTMIVLRTDAS